MLRSILQLILKLYRDGSSLPSGAGIKGSVIGIVLGSGILCSDLEHSEIGSDESSGSGIRPLRYDPYTVPGILGNSSISNSKYVLSK